MIKIHNLFDLIVTLIIIVLTGVVCETSSDDWAIHSACNHRSRFTRKELEDVKIYLQTRYINGASIKPQRLPCESLKVVRDFRCLSEIERRDFIKAFVKVYRQTEFIDDISYLYTNYWSFVNLLAQTIAWHNKVNIDVQKELKNFDASVIMPYWDISSDATAPEKALVWDYFGHAGNQHNDYCVPDGPFNNLTLKCPNNTCLKREWNIDGTINHWESPEVITYNLQQGVGNLGTFGPLLYAQHFKKHMYIGGLRGNMANVWATNEPIFNMFHFFDAFIQIIKWQLQNDTSLVDLFWNNYGRHEPPYSYTGTVVPANIENDTLLGSNTTTVAEAFSHGFGEFCYIPDRVIEAILGILSNRRPRYPPAVQRLRDALPSDVFAEFFPLFADNTATQLNYHLPEVGNTNLDCKPLPVPLRYNQTDVGLQEFARFDQIGVNIQPLILSNEQKIIDFIETLNRYNYCSPYVH